MSIKLLHISNDEKFIDSAIEFFEFANPEHNVYLINGNPEWGLRRVRSTNKNIKVYPYFSKKYWSLIKDTNPKLLIIHGLSIKHKYLLKKIGKNYKVFWSSWGRDLFSTQRLEEFLYKEKTRKLVEEIATENRAFRRWIANVVYWILKPERRVSNNLESYFSSINYMSTVVEEDYEYFKAAYQNEIAHIKYLPFNYGNVIYNLKERFSAGGDILIGNSANFENNHIETFEIVKNLMINKRKIIVPLSYGGNNEYVNRVLKIGRQMFGDQFYPITDFLPKEEYHKILDDIGFAFMYHSHQHAMGNIIRLLYKGAKIFMDPTNSAYQHLIKKNVKVYDINIQRGASAFISMSAKDKEKNRRIIWELYNDERLKEQTKDLIQSIISDITE